MLLPALAGAAPTALTALTLTALALTACASSRQDDRGATPAPTSAAPSASPTATAGAGASATPSAGSSGSSAPYAGADELGGIPVLMYHQLISRPGRDDVTPDQFRAELQRLYDEGYRPITAADLVAGRVDVPAGTHPVVLSFDDATVSQARIGRDGQPAPDTALGILEAFGREHPDFHPTATFFVNTEPPPFVDAAVLPWLAAHGYEIGAHTRSHAFLRQLSNEEVQAQIGGNIADIEAAVPGYTVRTFATTGGIWPRDASLARRGTYQGRPYELAGVFGVDEVAAPSPYAAAFNPRQVPRVGTGDVATLLDRLAAHPERRYTSDGDPATVAYPAARDAELAAAWRDRARPG